MSESKFKTLRHIETVRNFLNTMVREILTRAERHDQTKLGEFESKIFDEFTPKLRGCTYGSDEYKGYLKEMEPALQSHYLHNRHHPEYFQLGTEEYNTMCFDSPLERMNLIDLLEMVCDWKAATLRHDDGDIFKSIEINQERFGYTDELKRILVQTAHFLNDSNTEHHAEES